MRHRLIALVAWGALVCPDIGLAGQAAQNPNELARLQYEFGLGLLQKQQFIEALKDFQAVVDSYPTSTVAADALIEIARYHLEVARDAQAAQAATDIILKKYPSTAAAAAGHVLNGRIALARGRTPADVNTALASFERVRGLFPGSDVIPSSIYYAGEGLRVVRRYNEAIEQFRDVTLKYPGSVWAARSMVSAAICLTATGRAASAMDGLQRVRVLFPDTPEAAVALNWNTILYRLYVRPPAQPPYAYIVKMFGSPTGKFKDVTAVAVDRRDNILLAHKQGLAVFDGKGTLVKSVTAENPTAIAFGPLGQPLVARDNVLAQDGGPPLGFAIPQPDGKANPINDIAAVLMTSQGDWLVADRKAKAIQIFSASGKYVKPFLSGQADRLALNALDDVAILERDAKSVLVVSRDAKTIGRIQTRGAGYELDTPVDIAYDSLGHLYVLDRGKAAVYVFSPDLKLVTSFSIPEKSPGALHKALALGLDSAARLYIFDDRSQHVQLYQ